MHTAIVLILVGAVLFVLLAKRRLGALRDRLLGWIAIVLGTLAITGGVLAGQPIGDSTGLISIGLIVAGLYYAFRPRPTPTVAGSPNTSEDKAGALSLDEEILKRHAASSQAKSDAYELRQKQKLKQACSPEEATSEEPPSRQTDFPSGGHLKRLLIIVDSLPSEGRERLVAGIIDNLFWSGRSYRSLVDNETSIAVVVSGQQDFADQALLIAAFFRQWGTGVRSENLAFQTFSGRGGNGATVLEFNDH